MRKLLITLSGKGGEICGGVLPEELTAAIHAKKALIQKYGSGVEHNDEILPWSEIDNFAHAFGTLIAKGTVTIVDGKKKHKIKVKDHDNLDMTWGGWPHPNQFNSGKNIIIITNMIQDGDFGYYYLELEDNEEFDQNKLYIGYISFDEFGIEDYEFVVDLFYGDIHNVEFESFIEEYSDINNAMERERFCKNKLPKGIVNIVENFEDDFSTQNKGSMKFVFECKADENGSLVEDFTLKNKFSL
jgi:hypothetical protein